MLSGTDVPASRAGHAVGDEAKVEKPRVVALISRVHMHVPQPGDQVLAAGVYHVRLMGQLHLAGGPDSLYPVPRDHHHLLRQ